MCALSEHYFTTSPTSPHERRIISYTPRGGRELSFETDAGVFSKTRVDRGTDQLIQAIRISPGQSLLDLGCGYGVVGISIASLHPECEIWMTDINERACELARANARRNGVERVTVVSGDGFDPVRGRMFHVIATNPPIRAGRAVLYRLIEEAHDHLEPGGSFYAVVRTKQGAASLKAFIAQTYGNADEPEIGGGYRVIRAFRE
ncbi:MAG TPA: methyltransferase [Bacillota bacterium]|nr:class I SAM-dependent methyltransferase [Bacillota bacterium]HOK70083.1 methyltransferase [Bacillota bacterium]HOL51637.1 methyltransferase [Bacillota bacterium]HPQ03238.1 methyltransferase [Bacillota bacterium]